MLTVRIQEKNHSESIMVLKLKDGYKYITIRISTYPHSFFSFSPPCFLNFSLINTVFYYNI